MSMPSLFTFMQVCAAQLPFLLSIPNLIPSSVMVPVSNLTSPLRPSWWKHLQLIIRKITRGYASVIFKRNPRCRKYFKGTWNPLKLSTVFIGSILDFFAAKIRVFTLSTMQNRCIGNFQKHFGWNARKPFSTYIYGPFPYRMCDQAKPVPPFRRCCTIVKRTYYALEFIHFWNCER